MEIMKETNRGADSSVLITGANGFIGSALVRRLVKQGIEVRCLVHRNRQQIAGLPVKIFEGSVTRRDTLEPALSGVNVVYHLGALASDWGRRDQFFRVNTEGTRNVIEAAIAADVHRVIHMSSLAVHRFTGHLDADETTPANQFHYAYSASKVAAEELALQAHRQGRIEVSIVRPGVVVYGPGDTTVFIQMAPLLEKGRWVHVSRGRPWMCCVYVENLVDGMILMGHRREAAGEIFNITDDIKLTWKEYFHENIAAFEVQERTLSIAAPFARAAGVGLDALFRLVRSPKPPPINDYRTALVSKDFHFVCDKAKALLGYQPRVDLKEGLASTVSWYRELN
jgi:nucleoside-diphosphate-sugar epimerase